MAPPTIAMQIRPEPSGARSPSPSEASEKIVGNMIELNRPIEIRLKPEATPVESAETNSSVIAQAAAAASTLPGGKRRSRPAPMKRPTIAPPQ